MTATGTTTRSGSATNPGTEVRRTLHFDTLDDAIADAASLAEADATTTGHFSLGQILEHLARTLDVVTGYQPAPPVPAPMRWLAILLRSRILNRPMKPGLKLPRGAQSVLWPDEPVEVDAAIEHLRQAAARFRETDPLPPHPFFGTMSPADHERLQCRHFELHLSFATKGRSQ